MSRFVYPFLFILLFLFMVQCSDKNVEPVSKTPAIIDISGITVTDIEFSISSTDPSDWCYQWPFPSNPIPLEYAFYPVTPNPGSQRKMIKYDIPEAAHVKIYAIDSTTRVIKNIYDKNKPAGRYWTFWDNTDNHGNGVDDGFYRLIMETDSFQCHGDIQNTSLNVADSLQLTVNVKNRGNSLEISYSSEIELSGMVLIVFSEGSIGIPSFYIATRAMSVMYNTINNTQRILILPSLHNITGMELPSMPAGSDIKLCNIPYTGELILGFVDASSNSGTAMNTHIVNIQ